MSFESASRPKIPPIESIGVPDGEVLIMDVKPQKESGKRDVLILPGMGAPLESYGPALDEFAKLGRHSLTLKHRTDHPREWFWKEYLALQERRADEAAAVLDAKGITDKVDLLAHSNGAVIGTKFAEKYPDRVKNILYVMPAGFIAGDSPVHLSLRGARERFGKMAPKASELLGIEQKTSMRDAKQWGKNMLTEEMRERAAQEGRHLPEYREIPMDEIAEFVRSEGNAAFAEHSEKNRALSFNEVVGMGWSWLVPRLPALREKGIKVLVAASVDDSLFPAKSIAESIPKDSVDGFLSLRGDHGTVMEHAKIYIPLMDDMLTKVDQKQSP